MKNILSRILFLSVFVTLSSSNVLADNIIIQSSTSLKNSGFYRYLAPILQHYTGVEIRVVAVGTGQAIKNMKNCDGDVLITHAKKAEIEFLKTGYGLKRFEFMYNNWVIVGPRKAKTEKDIRGHEIREIMEKIYDKKEKFISRGDNSGTHMKELSLWKELALMPVEFSKTWYLETGSGQGATLMIANELGAFTITDTATWYSFKNKGDSEIVGYDNNDLNTYAVTTVNPKKCKNVKTSAVEKIVTFLKSDNGKRAISKFRLNNANAFFPI